MELEEQYGMLFDDFADFLEVVELDLFAIFVVYFLELTVVAQIVKSVDD